MKPDVKAEGSKGKIKKQPPIGNSETGIYQNSNTNHRIKIFRPTVYYTTMCLINKTF